MMYMDFVGMKFYNARRGFAEGNKLLQSFARILAQTFGNENCCRIDADHFGVFSEEKGLKQRLQQVFRGFREINVGNTPPVHVGVYVAQFEKVHTSVACDWAKLACNSLRGRYVTAVSYYNKALSEEEARRQYIVENIDKALAEKWVKVYIQPIIRAVNERVCDVEALARWIDPEMGLLSPAEFIPALEHAGLIYKLDLYMVEQVLETIKAQMAAGIYLVPHSINLSRSDFDACDIVEEIRQRVDNAGVDRSLITIEITESVIGSDFEFMKGQVQRFQKLGFAVWMDDFGSGYSSLDVLQSIRFDLMKFDMSFMRKLDDGSSGKTILTELMRMATSLGVDTVCEGVETEEQARFLREIGCSKLQGYLYSKPMPFETILEMHWGKTLIAHENPEESEYYESIGRANLFDLGVIADKDADSIQNAFETIPIAILEIAGTEARYIRSNRSYQDFARKFFNFDILSEKIDCSGSKGEYGEAFLSVFKRCSESASSIFFDEKMPGGCVAHFFVRQINVNPVTGTMAAVIAVLSISAPDEPESQTSMARALAADYYSIYVVDLDTDRFTAYTSHSNGHEPFAERHGEHFFSTVNEAGIKHIYEDDQEKFATVFTKENVLTELAEYGEFIFNCRMIDTGRPVYTSMKITRIEGTNRIMIRIGNIDAQIKQLEKDQKLKELNQTITSVLNNMPGMTFTKDAKTGIYIACNQAFADYAHKATPDGVVGLTDAQIFDAETAAHFVEDDRLALSMKKPYIFFEDVLDAAGNQRQFQTTKFTYTDSTGRLCLQGMCLDVTDMDYNGMLLYSSQEVTA